MKTKSRIIFNRLFFYSIADDGTWFTIEKHKHVRIHVFTIDRVISTEGIKAWCIVLGKRKLSWAKLNQTCNK